MAKNFTQSKVSFFTLLTMLVMLFSWQLLQASESEQADVRAITAWSPPGTQLTSGSVKGGFPEVSYSPTNDDIIIVFSGWTSSESSRDPYFVYSTNNGSSWSSQIAIDTDSTVRSRPEVVFDSSGNIHVAWIGFNESNSNYSVLYAKSTNQGSSWSTQTLVNPTQSAGGVENVEIVTSGTNTVDIVFEGVIDAGGAIFDRTLWHMRSTNGGATWSSQSRVLTTDTPSTHPTLTVDDSNRLHLAWQQQTLEGQDVYYARFASNSWSTSILLSSDELVADDSYEPDILFANGTVHLAFAEGQEIVDPMNPNVNDDLQTVYYLSCATGSQTCESTAHWSNLTNISSQPLEVNETSPFYIIPSLAYDEDGNSLLVFFHGIRDGASSKNEIVWQNDSQSNWSQVGSVSDTSDQSINPNAVIEDCKVHLGYENALTNQVYYIQNDFGCRASGLIAYLPLITR